jgi:hypothetical protein
MVQLEPALRVVPQVVVREKSPALEPVIVLLLIVIVAVPVLRSVTTCALLEVFTACVANVSVVGVRLATGAVPVPVRVVCCGLVGSELLTKRLAVRVPVAVGLNVTLIVQLDPAVKVVPHVVVRA